MYTREYKDLHVIILMDEGERAQHMGYKYLVKDKYCTSVTAFRTKAGFRQWLKDTGLHMERRMWLKRCFEIHGKYKMVGLMMPREEFEALPGSLCRVLDNGSYTAGKITTDEEGYNTITFQNCNMKDRAKLAYVTD